jgi:hypothetical protein
LPPKHKIRAWTDLSGGEQCDFYVKEETRERGLRGDGTHLPDVAVLRDRRSAKLAKAERLLYGALVHKAVMVVRKTT